MLLSIVSSPPNPEYRNLLGNLIVATFAHRNEPYVGTSQK